MYVAALFRNAKNWKQSKCFSVGKWINQHPHMDYYSATFALIKMVLISFWLAGTSCYDKMQLFWHFPINHENNLPPSKKMPLKFWASFPFFFFFFAYYCCCCFCSPFKSKKIMWPQTAQLSQNTCTGINTCKVLKQNKTSFSSVQFSRSVVSNSLRPHESQPGLPAHHHLPEFTQTHVHQVSDAIQPSHPLSSPSPSALNLSQHQSLFQWVNSSHQVAKVLEFQLQHQSFRWTPRTDLL